MPAINTYALGTPTADQFRRLSGTSDEGAITIALLEFEGRLAALEVMSAVGTAAGTGTASANASP